MRRIINTFKNIIGIILDVPMLAFSACVIPFSFSLYALLTIPKILLSFCARHRFIFSGALVLLFFIVAIRDEYTIEYALSYSFSEFVVFFFKQAWEYNHWQLLGIVAGLALFPFLFITWFYKLFVKLDHYIQSIYYVPVATFRDRCEDIGRRARLVVFGSFRREELFEIRRFRKAYNLAY